MKIQYIENIRHGLPVDSVYLLQSKRLQGFRGKAGKFLLVVLGDRTGSVEARIWENGEELYDKFNPGDLVKISADTGEFKGKLQLNISSINIYRGKDVDWSAFLPVSPKDKKEMLKSMDSIIMSINNPDLAALLNLFFSDSEWLNKYSTAPAAKKHHQAYLGGLLEHSLNVAQACQQIARVYTQINRDLLLTGAILHDVGKIDEYKYERMIDMSDQGRLLGHIIIGIQMVDRAIEALPGFSDNLRLKLLHMIASHHGEYEWQSPKRPKFLEAYLLHQLDLLDARVDAFTRAAEDRVDSDEAWSDWVKDLERYIYKK
ncbi:metal dependent phosphohydrolase [Desulfofarcimen acetoxidans DSM 771]|jgi:3'-5' exoribonuclease|uniref:Metal dependent phosphohydrolase n=1 Tax=Desulfofarcimen acetoxidans (strain ATCC 49208 / DSM 771 / KCTC 5769 / VKM B-1644 / 5575) TaxID=485916 RepID=C8VXJ3_DESAS|nr:HD domain-containing protein [Desulfofarcimen acetoxidans]ACV62649.1 metal dependent phosphohydrolase [Desulfofarcimen acetoxidans DSM 771]